MVPTSSNVREVYSGVNGVIGGLRDLDDSSRSQTLCIDQSTIEQSISQEVTFNVRETGAEMIDAPVSGGE